MKHVLARWQAAGFGLYIHWPFCQSKCPYCDFNSHVSATVDIEAWRYAFIAELERWREWTGPRLLTSIFFGGGTPSLMPPDLVGEIVSRARSLWSETNDLEVTLEANPTSVEAGKFAAFRDSGINRVSIGVQALNSDDLRRLGRMHSVQEAKQAVEIAQSLFSRSSFDLIYGRQGQTLAGWEEELREALEMSSGHLSLYQLTIEPGTVFGERYRVGKLRNLPSEDLGADMYEATQALTEAFGLPAYEISNHSAPRQESRHNLIYWRSGDYLGIGPGAHGRLTDGRGARFATEAPKAPGAWLKSAAEGASLDSSLTPLSPLEVAEEWLVMGLRISEGVDLRAMASATGYSIDHKSINSLSELHLVESDGPNLRATSKGRPLLNAILSQLALVKASGQA